jgi:2-haloacid dehalogenase
MNRTLLFDVYGTLVDPAGMAEHLRADAGEEAVAFATMWREKQLEYSFRRGLMQHYATFAVCTADALAYTARRFGIELHADRRMALLAAYANLPAFPDAVPGLAGLRQSGQRLFAFSNGTAADVAGVLDAAGLGASLEGIISVDDVRSFKPNPAVYAHARRASGAWSGECWLVSGNAWDVIGARAAGLDAAWVRRANAPPYDSWGIEPTLTVASLLELSQRLSSSLS